MSHFVPKRWQVADPAPDNFIAAMKPLHAIVAQVLYNRGHTDDGVARAFLDGACELHSPFLLKDVGKAKGRIMRAVHRREPIAVYGDFDVDGVTATALLTLVLERLGANVRPHIPDRMTEGYGLNVESLQELATQGIKLVITVDCGIRSVEEVQAANDAGLDMIITDHHSIGPALPPALAVIDPKREDSAYPFRELAGVGVAYTLTRALLHQQQKHKAPPFSPDEYLDLVALGTVADIVPLVGENRYLVTRGLDVLNRTQRPGVLALMEVAGVSPGEVDAAGIGFRLGPRLNAAGRLESAMLSFELLSTSDRAQAAELAYELNEINQRRQTLTGEMQEIAAELAGLDDGNSPPLLFAADPAFHQGVVGLVASRLTEQTYRPSVVLEQGDEMSHGSCRSIPEFHITEALDRCAGLLVRHGGHAAAAGFTVRNEHIDALRSQLLDIAAEALGSYDLTPTLYIDAEVCLVDLTWDLVDQLTRLEPTGEQNRSPVLATRHLRVVDYRCVGREGNHLKFRVFDGKFAMNAIAFGWGHMVRQMPDYVDLAYHPEINEWRDKRSLQLFIHDIQPSEAPQ